MKYRDPKMGEVFEDIQNARISFCTGRICSEDCPFGCAATVERNPAEAARLMGLEVVEDAVTGVTQGGKSLFCEHIGVAPSQPFIVHGYPYRNCAPMVYGEDGCVRLYAPDGQKRHKVGGRAITWIVDHPESVEPCEGYTPQEVALKKEEPMEKKEKSRTCKNCGNNETKAGCGSCTCSKDDPNNPSGWKPVRPRICEVLGVELGEEWRTTGNDNATYRLEPECGVLEYSMTRPGKLRKWYTSDAVHLNMFINHPDLIIRNPQLASE